MHRLNLTIDEALYEQARLQSFISKKSISQIVRESLHDYMQAQKQTNPITQLLLDAKDEAEVLSVLAENTFISEDEFVKKFDL